jgi:hypothetical protein
VGKNNPQYPPPPPPPLAWSQACLAKSHVTRVGEILLDSRIIRGRLNVISQMNAYAKPVLGGAVGPCISAPLSYSLDVYENERGQE